MKVIDIVRLLKKHLVLLFLTPLLLGALVTYLTRNPSYTFSSETTLYTGIASGSSVEMDKSFSYFANNTAFDNLINVINSRETQKTVAIRLLAQHLMLDHYDPKYISKESFLELRKITPRFVYDLVAKEGGESKARKQPGDTTAVQERFSFENLDSAEVQRMQPASIDPVAYEQTVENLTNYLTSSDTNFVYKLLNFSHPHYSIKAISSVSVQRLASSDLVRLKYDSDDPGICQQTLVLMTEACIKNYKLIKETRSDAVVKYFEYQLKQAAARLKVGEDKLLKFNEDNNIINYYEQSKAVAVVKEDLDNEYNNKRIKLAGLKAAINRIEEKLGVQKQIQLKSSEIIDKRNQLSEISSQISTAEIVGYGHEIDSDKLAALKLKAETLKEDIRKLVNEFYSYGNSIDGLPVSSLLNDWIANVIEYEDTRAGLDVLGERIREFQKQYAIYAPAGANIKRIEREISVSEQEFLEILHGLNLAKLKSQDAELSATIRTVDEPFFPLSPNPTKRKILIIASVLFGFILALSIVLATEYFDDTLRNPHKAEKAIRYKPIGIFPKVFLKKGSLNFLFVANRLLEMLIQQIELLTIQRQSIGEPTVLLFFSSLSNEGKTVTAGNTALKLKMQGKKVLFLTFSRESLRQNETEQIGYPDDPQIVSTSGFIRTGKKSQLLNLILGYGDKRIDHDSPFLQPPSSYLSSDEFVTYPVNQAYFTVRNYRELLDLSGVSIKETPEIILLEIPPVLYYSYPPALVSSAVLAILVARANRIWTNADKGALDLFRSLLKQDPVVLLNGVEFEVIESMLGDLPRKRSRFRQVMKKIIRFQFYSRHQP